MNKESENNLQMVPPQVKEAFYKKIRKDSSLSVDELCQSFRREKINRPVIFVGVGTCGLAAGAGETMEQINSYLQQKQIEADVIEVGCVGLCSAEPIVDIQLPGKNRLSFQKVKKENVIQLLDDTFANKVPQGMLLGQYRSQHLQAGKIFLLLISIPFLNYNIVVFWKIAELIILLALRNILPKGVTALS